MQLVQSKSRTDDAEPVRDERFPKVLSEAIAITRRNNVAYLVAGSLASGTWGRPGTFTDTPTGGAKRA